MEDTSAFRRATEKVAAFIEILRQPSTRARTFVRAALAAGVLALFLFLISGPVSLYTPRACTICHAPGAAYSGWQSSAHSSVRCERCHTDRAALGGIGNSFALASDVWRSVSGGTSSNVAVRDDACLSCHPAASLTKPVVVNGLRMSHKGLAEARYRCVDCHAATAHDVSQARLTAPTMSLCARCHNNVRASGDCKLCHSETRSADAAKQSDPEWSKTHGPNWRQLHGMGDLSTCTMCHKSTECQQCHNVPLPHDANFIGNHGTIAKQSRQACLSCHAPSFCDNCHGLPIPHPAGFLSQHPTIAKSEADPRCMRCHVQDDCTSCHTQHVHPHGPAVGK